MKSYICPSMLACDFTIFGEEATTSLFYGSDRLHMDIMDGHFVPNISFGIPLLQSLRSLLPNIYLDCHMMVSEPEKWIKPFSEVLNGNSGFTFHLEATTKPIQLIESIKQHNMNVGIAINPKTPLDELLLLLENDYVRDNLDLVLIMTVEPGFGGQSFMEDMIPKIKKLRNMYPKLNIQVDGGISEKNVNLVTEAGANNIVAGSAIFKSKDIESTITNLRRSILENCDCEKYNSVCIENQDCVVLESS